MHWFDHFVTKLSKYLWVKTGDRHYHFVEPWVIDRPFCRMETVYQNHFVETGVGSLQNGAPQPPQGMGRRIFIMVFTVITVITICITSYGYSLMTSARFGKSLYTKMWKTTVVSRYRKVRS